MHNLIQKFRNDHKDLRQLLASMHAEVDQFRDGNDPDFHHLCEIVRCVIHWSDVCHHPAEDAVFAFVSERRSDLKLLIARLTREHIEIERCSKRLFMLLDGVRSGHIVPREELLVELQTFPDEQEWHMSLEENEIFSACAEYIGTTEWLMLELEVHEHFEVTAEPKIKAEFQWLWDTINDVEDQSDAA